MWVEVRNVSLEDCDMFTSSFGCTVVPGLAQIDAITSLAFMLELVPTGLEHVDGELVVVPGRRRSRWRRR